MAKPGTKPKPTQLKLVNGNPGRRPLPKKEAVIDPDLYPGMPPQLKGKAKEEWIRNCDLLFDVGLMTVADRNALAAYCVAFAHWVDAEAELEGKPLIVYSATGNAGANPLIGIAKDAMMAMVKLGCEFGMTPSSRSRVEANPPNVKSKEAKKAIYY